MRGGEREGDKWKRGRKMEKEGKEGEREIQRREGDIFLWKIKTSYKTSDNEAGIYDDTSYGD